MFKVRAEDDAVIQRRRMSPDKVIERSKFSKSASAVIGSKTIMTSGSGNNESTGHLVPNVVDVVGRDSPKWLRQSGYR
jgi:hypothetical protein